MIWYKDLYVGESIVHKTKKVKWKIMHNAGQIGIYVITLASNTQNLLDIIPSYELMQKGYPKKDMVVVGLAKGYDEAIEVAASIVDEVYHSTGTFAVRAYLAENFGWGGELNLTYIFEKLFCAPGGGGYPKERVEPEQRNKKILDEVKKVTHRDLVSILKELDRDLVVGALSGEHFSEYFFANCKDETIAACVKELIG